MENIQALIDNRIDAMVSEVMSAVRTAASAALMEALGGPATRPGGPSQSSFKRKVRRGSAGPRRTAAELTELCERLYQQINDAPGKSMSFYAKQLDTPSVALAVVVGKLKKSGRVRKAGERSQTRYFAMGPV